MLIVEILGRQLFLWFSESAQNFRTQAILRRFEIVEPHLPAFFRAHSRTILSPSIYHFGAQLLQERASGLYLLMPPQRMSVMEKG
jgi:hypothetical protein